MTKEDWENSTHTQTLKAVCVCVSKWTLFTLLDSLGSGCAVGPLGRLVRAGGRLVGWTSSILALSRQRPAQAHGGQKHTFAL